MMQGWQYGGPYGLHGGWALLLAIAAMVVIYGIPAIRIVRRVGLSGWWGLLAAVPLVNIVALWVFAFCRWPRDEAA